MQNTKNEFDIIFAAWKKLELLGKLVIHDEIATLEANGINAMTVATSYIKHKSFYRAYIKRVIVDTPNISKFFEEVRSVSEEAYEFLSDGHDFIHPCEYFLFEENFDEKKNDRIFEMKSYSRYLAYAFRRIIEQEDESKKKSILRGLLGM